MAAQDRAVEPAARGRRKIVLATSIAETSLTIEGVRVVIDSGLMRVPRYEPDIGLTRLETVRVSRANADQRRGRAGRVEPGVCYRLWEEAATGGLQPYAAPEILSADLSGFLLDCAVWGETDPTRLAFLDPPPRGALKEARTLLGEIGAIDAMGRITDEGRAIARLALPPRLARMVVDAARAGEARDRRGDRGASHRARPWRRRGRPFGPPRRLPPRPRAARRRCAAAGAGTGAERGRGHFAGRGRAPSPGERVGGEGRLGALLASAYPDRIAMARGKRGEFLMANGRAAGSRRMRRSPASPSLRSARSSAARLRRASCSPPRSTLADIEAVAGPSIETADELTFDRASASLRARRAGGWEP